jgi:hypothetical protein
MATVGGGCASTTALGKVTGRLAEGGKQGLRAGRSCRGGGALPPSRDSLPTVMVMAGPQKELRLPPAPTRCTAEEGAEVRVCTLPAAKPGAEASWEVREVMICAEAVRVALLLPAVALLLADSAPMMLARVLSSTGAAPPSLLAPPPVLLPSARALASAPNAASELAVPLLLLGVPHSRLTWEAEDRALAAACRVEELAAALLTGLPGVLSRAREAALAREVALAAVCRPALLHRALLAAALPAPLLLPLPLATATPLERMVEAALAASRAAKGSPEAAAERMLAAALTLPLALLAPLPPALPPLGCRLTGSRAAPALP